MRAGRPSHRSEFTTYIQSVVGVAAEHASARTQSGPATEETSPAGYELRMQRRGAAEVEAIGTARGAIREVAPRTGCLLRSGTLLCREDHVSRALERLHGRSVCLGPTIVQLLSSRRREAPWLRRFYRSTIHSVEDGSRDPVPLLLSGLHGTHFHRGILNSGTWLFLRRTRSAPPAPAIPGRIGG